MDQIADTVYVKPKRTTFLTVLCILTFLGSGYGIFSGIIAYKGAPKFASEAKAQMEKNRQQSKGKNTNPQAQKWMNDSAVFFDAEKVKKNSIAGIACNLITFVGAFLMFRMNKTGFLVYVLGTIAGVAAPLFIFGNNSLAGFLAYIPGFFGLVFIIMYAFNLRDMKPQPLYD